MFLCILVNFEKCAGPSIYWKFVPVPPVTSLMKYQGVSCILKQFPMVIVCAISVHKSYEIIIGRAIGAVEEIEF